MPRPTNVPHLQHARPARLRTVVRALAWWHVAVSVVSLAAGLYFVYAYLFLSDPDDNLAGVALILGVIALALGAAQLGLALGTLRARRPLLAYGLGVGAGLFGQAVVLPAAAIWLPRTYGAPVLGLVSLALVGCSLAALVRRVESPAGNL